MKNKFSIFLDPFENGLFIRKIFFLLMFLAWILPFSSCSNLDSISFKSLLNSQIHVTQVTPSTQRGLSELSKIEIIFSDAIHESSLSPNAIFLAEGEIDSQNYAEPEKIESAVISGAIKRVGSSITLRSESNMVDLNLDNTIYEGIYTLVVTPQLEGENHIPFNQNPGMSPSAYFCSFYVGSSTSADPSSNSSTETLNPESSPSSRPEALVLNEILYDGKESDTDGYEFIELYGTPNAELSGYQVILVNGSDGVIQKIITLPSNSKTNDEGIFLIADLQTGSTTKSRISGAQLLENFDPQNGPDAIQLLDEKGNLIDALTYGTGAVEMAKNGLSMVEGNPSKVVSAGHSLSRVGGKDTDENSVDFTELEIPSPGVIELPEQAVPESAPQVGDSGSDSLQPISQPKSNPSPSDPNQQTPESNPGSTPPDPQDPNENPPSHFLVLNEVLYDAVGTDTDGNEFIEIYGTPDTDVGGYQILILNGDDGKILDTIFLPAGAKVRADGLFLIADSKTSQPTASNILNPDFIDNFDPQNGPDGFQLLDPQGNLVDALSYGTGAFTQAENGLIFLEGSAAIDVSAGHSLSRMNGADTQQNALDFLDLTNPTPGIL